MSIYGGPAIVTDSLGMKLDAANKKSYDPNLESLDVECLIVAGGGGGGGYAYAGGGGAGGLLYGIVEVSGSISVVVGAGGAGGARNLTGGTGSNSSLGSHTANGGGGGGSQWTSSAITAGDNGGSGGGASMYHRYYGYAGAGIGISNQGDSGSLKGYGNNGGKSDFTSFASFYPGGGGGGATQVGYNASYGKGGNGGNGLYVANIFGTSVGGDNGWFAGGGGGGMRSGGTIGYGGEGGGGNGVAWAGNGTAGSVNTGGGGGAGTGNTYSSVSAIQGGSGIVVIKYTGPQKASGGNTIFSYNGYTVHVFISSGTFTVGEAWGDLAKKTFKTKLVNSPSHNNISKGVFYFDGTNQYIRPSTPHSYLSSSSIGLFFKALSVNVVSNNNNFKYATLIGYRHNAGYSQPTIGSLTLRSVNNGSSYFLHASLITASQVYRSTTTSVNLNQWYYAVLVKDTVNGIMSIYVNGQFKNSVTFDAATYGQWTQAGQYIGANILDIGKSSGSSNQGWGNDYFNGYIGNIRLYTRVLNDNEIMKNFRALKGRYGL